MTPHHGVRVLDVLRMVAGMRLADFGAEVVKRGREGPHSAMQEMTEERLVTLRLQRGRRT